MTDRMEVSVGGLCLSGKVCLCWGGGGGPIESQWTDVKTVLCMRCISTIPHSRLPGVPHTRTLSLNHHGHYEFR